MTGAAGTTVNPTGAAGTTSTGAAGTDATGAAGTTATGAAGTDATGAAGTNPTGAAGTNATGAAGTDATGAAGTGAAGTAPVDNAPTIPLPITVSTSWYPSGYFGDAYTQSLFASTDPVTRPITMAIATDGPCAARVAGAVGDCWKVTYNPQVAADGGAPGFAGVAFLSDLAPMVPNWDMPLKAPRPAQGGTKVVFQVAGAAGGEAVDFSVGLMGEGLATKQSPTLMKTWQPVTLSFAGGYDHVLSGFGWASASATKIVFYFDDITFKQ